MTNYLEINLQRIASENAVLADALRQAYHPEAIEVRLAKDGSPVPVVEKKCLHSPYDPAAEARRWRDELKLQPDSRTTYVVGGMGFGYHLAELLKSIPPQRIVVVERDASLAAACLAHRPPEIFPEGLKLVVGQTPSQVYFSLRKCNSEPQHQFKFIEHPVSTRLHPEYYRTLAGMLQTQNIARRGGFKILLVSPLYGGSLPMTFYVQSALSSLGHRCEVLDNTVFYPGLKHLEKLTTNRSHQGQLRGQLTALLAESITARAVEMRADLVLGLAQSPVTVEVLAELKQADILTAFWFVEDGELFQYWKNYSPNFDHYFVIQKGEFLDQLKAAGCSNPYYLPLAADPQCHLPLNLSAAEQEEFGSDISHVGAGYHNRRQVFAGLLDYNFKLWGNDWENPGPLASILQRNGARLSTEDSMKVFNASKINLNLHSSTYHEGVNPYGDFLNPRTFEIACCGAFQLVDERRYLMDCLKMGEEIISFKNVKELREKIDHYLHAPLERIQIAQAGRQRVLVEHTYQHRMLELLGVIAGQRSQWQPKSGGLPTAEEIIGQAGADSELGAVMQRFKGRGSLTLEEVAAEIEKGAGDLGRTEAMILLLNEFRRWGLGKGVL